MESQKGETMTEQAELILAHHELCGVWHWAGWDGVTGRALGIIFDTGQGEEWVIDYFLTRVLDCRLPVDRMNYGANAA